MEQSRLAAQSMKYCTLVLCVLACFFSCFLQAIRRPSTVVSRLTSRKPARLNAAGKMSLDDIADEEGSSLSVPQGKFALGLSGDELRFAQDAKDWWRSVEPLHHDLLLQILHQVFDERESRDSRDTQSSLFCYWLENRSDKDAYGCEVSVDAWEDYCSDTRMNTRSMLTHEAWQLTQAWGWSGRIKLQCTYEGSNRTVDGYRHRYVPTELANDLQLDYLIKGVPPHKVQLIYGADWFNSHWI